MLYRRAAGTAQACSGLHFFGLEFSLIRYDEMKQVTRRLAIGIVCVATATLWAAPPILHTIEPFGCQRGKSTLVKLGGKNLQNATALFFTQPGVTAKRSGKGKFRVSVAADATPGMCDVWIVTPEGLAGPRRFFVDNLENVNEVEPNDLSIKAQDIPLIRRVVGASVFGSIGKPTDIDWYSIRTTSRGTATIRCWSRSADGFTFPALRVVSDNGREVAHSKGGSPEPVLLFKVRASTTYQIRVCDRAFEKHDTSVYRLTVVTSAELLQATPAVISSAQTRVRLRGLPRTRRSSRSVFSRIKDSRVTTQSGLLDVGTLFLSGRQVHSKRAHGTVRVGQSNAPVIVEAAWPKSFQPIPQIPAHIIGNFRTANNVDWYEFDVKKGERIHINAYGERLAQKMDLDVALHHAQGKLIQRFPNAVRPKGIPAKLTLGCNDVNATWKATLTGKVRLAIRDLYGSSIYGRHRRYEIVLTRSPDFRVVAMTPGSQPNRGLQVKRKKDIKIELLAVRLGQSKQTIRIEAENLPAGITAKPVTLRPGKSVINMTLHASAEAKPGAYLIRLMASTVSKGQSRRHVVQHAAIIRPPYTRLTDGIVVSVQ